MIIVIGIIVLLALAGAFLLATARQRSKTDTGKLSRSTRRADSSQPPEGFVDDASSKVVAVKDEDDASVPMVSEDKSPVRYEPVDEEELGVTRRQFFNRGILTGLALGVGGFGAAALAFLWPTGSSGFGGKITVGRCRKGHRGKNPVLQRFGQGLHRGLPQTRHQQSGQGLSLHYHFGYEPGLRCPLPKVPPPRLSSAVVLNFAVVRMSVSRI